MTARAGRSRPRTTFDLAVRGSPDPARRLTEGLQRHSLCGVSRPRTTFDRRSPKATACANSGDLRSHPRRGRETRAERFVKRYCPLLTRRASVVSVISTLASQANEQRAFLLPVLPDARIARVARATEFGYSQRTRVVLLAFRSGSFVVTARPLAGKIVSNRGNTVMVPILFVARQRCVTFAAPARRPMGRICERRQPDGIEFLSRSQQQR